MNKVTQDKYINWLDGAYKQYFSDLTKYQDEYNKYEEEVYKYRTDREQKLFDKKIDNLERHLIITRTETATSLQLLQALTMPVSR